MKINKQNLQKLIERELGMALRENDPDVDPDKKSSWAGAPERMFRSKEPYTSFGTIKQLDKGGRDTIKPNGLWYSCGAAWDDYCRIEGREMIHNSPHVYEIKLNTSKIIQIGNWKEFNRFWVQYGNTKHLGVGEGLSASEEHLHHLQSLQKVAAMNTSSFWDLDADMYQPLIDWEYVAERYHGIEICPHQAEVVVDMAPWYKNWSVASGCIWNGDAIVSVEKIEDRCQIDF